MNADNKNEFKPLFQSDSLEGWKIVPRGIFFMKEGTPEYEEAWNHKGLWTVKDGVVEGRQDPPGCGKGSYLISNAVYDDYELMFEAKPDWPADTGVYLRATEDAKLGYQVLLDYRKSGNVGGFYGNGYGFHAVNFNLDAEVDEDGVLLQLKEEDPDTTIEAITSKKREILQYTISGEEFLRIWKVDDWNEFHIVIKGQIPTITTIINGIKVAEIDLSKVSEDCFAPYGSKVHRSSGHIALEVHDNDPILGKDRWGKGSACRWRNFRVREL